MSIKIHQFKIPTDQLEKITLALDYLNIENYSLFENMDSPRSPFYDQNDLPLANEFILETDEQIEALKQLGFEHHEKTAQPFQFLNDQKEEIIIGSFVINPKLTPIYLEGSMAFGTGHHQTTQECLLALDHLKNKNIASVLDLGCGSGVLAIAAQKLFKTVNVDASDIDPVAVDIAQQNCVNNNTSIHVYLSDGFEQLPNRSYELIIANILLNPLCMLAPEIIKRSLRYIIVSGIIESQRDDLLKTFESLAIEKELKLDEWTTFILKKT